MIDRLAADLRREFPEMTGFSPRNLESMRALADAFPDRPFVQATLAQIPRYHAITLLDRVRDPVARESYIARTVEHGWTRNVLALSSRRGSPR